MRQLAILALALGTLLCACERSPTVIETKATRTETGGKRVTVVIACHGTYWANCEIDALKQVDSECTGLARRREVRSDKSGGDAKYPERMTIEWECGFDSR